MTKDEALNLALQALETLMIERGSIYDKAITAIKEALAQPEPWEKFCDSNCVWTDHHPDCKLAQPEPVACVTYKEVADTMNGLWGGTLVQRQIAEELENTMLYTTPPQSKPLTDEEIILIVADCASSHQHTDIHFARAIEAKLREKNNG